MTLNEKRQLVILLQQYQDEQIGLLEDAKERIKIAEQQGKSKWSINITFGHKAQYEHARIISARLSKEINRALPSYWEL